VIGHKWRTAIVAFIRHRAFIQSQCQNVIWSVRWANGQVIESAGALFYRRSALLILFGEMTERIERCVK
jgi:hypothetical protein